MSLSLSFLSLYLTLSSFLCVSLLPPVTCIQTTKTQNLLAILGRLGSISRWTSLAFHFYWFMKKSCLSFSATRFSLCIKVGWWLRCTYKSEKTWIGDESRTRETEYKGENVEKMYFVKRWGVSKRRKNEERRWGEMRGTLYWWGERVARLLCQSWHIAPLITVSLSGFSPLYASPPRLALEQGSIQSSPPVNTSPAQQLWPRHLSAHTVPCQLQPNVQSILAQHSRVEKEYNTAEHSIHQEAGGWNSTGLQLRHPSQVDPTEIQPRISEGADK